MRIDYLARAFENYPPPLKWKSARAYFIASVLVLLISGQNCGRPPPAKHIPKAISQEAEEGRLGQTVHRWPTRGVPNLAPQVAWKQTYRP